MHARLTTALAAMSLTAFSVSLAQAQTPPITPAVEPGPDNHHSSTIDEAFLTGLARAIRARGQANFNTAAAMILMEDAKEHYLRNYRDAVDTRQEVDRKNREYRLEKYGSTVTPEQIRRIRERQRPERLTSTRLDRYSGQIEWPDALQYGWFDQHRQHIEPVFVRWVEGRGGRGTQVHGQVKKLARAMEAELRDHVKQIDQYEYIVAKKFLRSLRLEAQLPPHDIEPVEVSQSLAAGRIQ